MSIDHPDTNPPVKIIFRLQQDEDGYPPCGYESVWAARLPDGTYQIDNIPWYTYDAACGDIVATQDVDGELFFSALVQPSGNSLVRVIVYNTNDIMDLHEQLQALGCKTELMGKLLAVHVPATASYAPIFQYLMRGQDGGRWTFEEAVLCHERETPVQKQSVCPSPRASRRR